MSNCTKKHAKVILIYYFEYTSMLLNSRHLPDSAVVKL